jgi:hypothetical protein
MGLCPTFFGNVDPYFCTLQLILSYYKISHYSETDRLRGHIQTILQNVNVIVTLRPDPLPHPLNVTTF